MKRKTDHPVSGTSRGQEHRQPTKSEVGNGYTANRDPGFLRFKEWLPGLLLVVATFLAYSPAWQGKPVWDDDAHITPPELRSLSGLARIWVQPGATQQYYPFVCSVFWLEHALWGDSTPGYHLVSLLLHAASALLLLKILRLLKVPGALLAAAIFALHPVQVESVAWISELKNTLSGILYFGSALAYLKFDRIRSGRFYAAAFGLFVLGLLSKTVIATLPAGLLLVFWWKRGRLSWKQDAVPLAPFFLVGLPVGLLTAWFERKLVHAEGATFSYTLIERCLIAGRALWFYVGKLCWPAKLAFIYPRWNVSQAEGGQYLFPLTALLVVAAAWLLSRRRNRGLLAGVLYFAGTLFPALGFFNAYPFRYSFVADHFQYLASVGILALGSAGLALVLERLRLWGRTASNLLCMGLVATLAALSWQQSRMYSNIETLWRVTLATDPEAFLAHNNLAVILRGRGQVDEAIAHLRKALEIQPDFAEAHNNLGNALLQHGQIEEAIAHFRRAFEIEPNNAPAHANLGSALIQMGRVDDSIAQFQMALAARPDNVELLNTLAYALIRKGRVDEAIVHLQRAIELSPSFADAHNNLANILLQKGRVEEAIAHYRKALETAPDNTATLGNLGQIFFRKGRTEEAIACFEKAARLLPDSAEAQNTLANAYMRAGRADEAKAHFLRALELRPDFAPAHNNLGLVLFRAGQTEQALAHFQEALAIEPGDAPTHRNLAQVFIRQGRAREAIEQYQAALSSQPTDVLTLNNLAWVLATFPEDTARNGPKAVELAQQANRLSGGADPSILATLAAAYAEAGRFAEAISTATKTLDLASARTNTGPVDVLRARIKLYQAGIPFRETNETNTGPRPADR